MMPTTKSARNNDDPDARMFLTTIGSGRVVKAFHKEQRIFAQGDTAGAVFYILQGKVRHSVVSRFGKEITLDLLSEGEFLGYCGLAGQPFFSSSATAMTDCTLMQIDNAAMMLELNKGFALSELFISYLLARNVQNQEELVNQFFGASEMRIARVLLLLADFGKDGKAKAQIAEVSQEALADKAGATRMQVRSSMNRFRKSGFLAHDRNGLQIRSTLLHAVLTELPRAYRSSKGPKHQ